MLTFRYRNTNAWQIPGHSTQVVLFSFAFFPTSEAAQGAPEIYFHILYLTRVVTSIFYILIHTRYELVLQQNLGILYEKYIGENIARGGTPLWRKNRFLFIQKVVRNRLVWGMRPFLFFRFKKKNLLSHTRIVQDNRIFIFWSLFSPFFD